MVPLLLLLLLHVAVVAASTSITGATSAARFCGEILQVEWWVRWCIIRRS